MKLVHRAVVVVAISILSVSAVLPFGLVYSAGVDPPASVTSDSPQVVAIDKRCSSIDRSATANAEKAQIYGDVSDGTVDAPAQWASFASAQALKDQGGALDVAYVWKEARRIVYVSTATETPSGDWGLYVDYCFLDSGRLAKLASELRTFYGNMSIHRVTYFGPDSKELAHSAEYRDLETGTPTTVHGPGGEGFQDEPVPVYLRVTELPFYSLLRTVPP